MVMGFTITETEIVESFTDGRRMVDVTVTYTWLNLEPLEGSTIDYNVWFGDTPLAASANPVLSLLDSYGVCKILLFCMHTLHAFHMQKLLYRKMQQEEYPLNGLHQVRPYLRFTCR